MNTRVTSPSGAPEGPTQSQAAGLEALNRQPPTKKKHPRVQPILHSTLQALVVGFFYYSGVVIRKIPHPYCPTPTLVTEKYGPGGGGGVNSDGGGYTTSGDPKASYQPWIK